MSERSGKATRRTVLKTTGASLLTLAGSGLASANHEHPNVETVGSSTVSADSAILYGDLTDIGDSADFASVWFGWGPSSEGFTNMTTSEIMYSPGEFSATISGLEPDRYQFRAAAKDSDDTFTFFGDTMYHYAGYEP